MRSVMNLNLTFERERERLEEKALFKNSDKSKTAGLCSGRKTKTSRRNNSIPPEGNFSITKFLIPLIFDPSGKTVKPRRH